MATQRPGFTRADTDIPLSDVGHATSTDIEKKGASPEVTSLNDGPPIFDAAKEDHFGEADVISDAKGVLTHVIHVDDDPSLSPWTFRALFLGQCSTALRLSSLIFSYSLSSSKTFSDMYCVLQVLASQYSHPSSRKSTISSHKPSMSPSSSSPSLVMLSES